MKKVVVIGGVAAGMSAASKLKRMAPDVEIEVYTEEKEISYSACSLPYLAKNIISDEKELIARTPEEMKEKGINVFIEHKVTQIYPERKEIEGKDRKGEVFCRKYNRLILATGSINIVPAIEDIEAPGVFTVKNIPDIHNITSYIGKWECRKAVVIGGGFIGVEMADALKSNGLEVTVLEKADQIMSIMDKDIAQNIQDYMEAQGISVCIGEEAEKICTGEGGRVSAVQTKRGITVPADLVIIAIGLRPNTELAERAGIELGTRGAIRVNEYMETSVKDIYAAGDCATSIHLVTNSETNICLGTVANRSGKICGENVAGKGKKYKGEIGTTVFKVFEKEGAKTGLNCQEAKRAGMDVFETTIQGNTRASGYPGRGSIRIKLITEKRTNRVVGAEIFGDSGAAKRIDVIAAYVQLKRTVDELAELDMGYAPPFSPVWDPVLTAASQAQSMAKQWK